MPGEILVLAEHRDDRIAGATREAIGFGQKLAGQIGLSVRVLLIGSRALADEISRAHRVEVLCVSGDRFLGYAPATYCEVVSQVVRQLAPHLVLMGHTYQAVDLAPRLATMLGRGLAANCVDALVVDGRLVFVRPVFGGKLLRRAAPIGDPPYFLSLQQGAFRVQDPAPGETSRVADVRIEPFSESVARRALRVIREAQDRVDLTKAEIIVAGGRGLGSKENFQVILELARGLGGAVGATRPVVDGGWLPKEHQIGVSGQTVAPKLYVACGISGSHQHVVGMTGARCVVAINKDPDAPIFNVARYGIVGDVFQVVPSLIETAKRVRGIVETS